MSRKLAIVDLDRLVFEAGESLATDRVRDLRHQKRPLLGAWPGTISEARACVLATIRGLGLSEPISTERLHALARTAYGAARTKWSAYCVPDPEP